MPCRQLQGFAPPEPPRLLVASCLQACRDLIGAHHSVSCPFRINPIRHVKKRMSDIYGLINSADLWGCVPGISAPWRHPTPSVGEVGLALLLLKIRTASTKPSANVAERGRKRSPR